MNTSDATLARARSGGAAAHGPAPLVTRLLRAKGMSLVMTAMNGWARLLHRMGAGRGSGHGPRIARLDHVTMPCRDLRLAEEFYVGVLGARVLLRVDEAFLRRMGRGADAAAGAVHTSVVFGAGARVDLFVQSDGQPPPLSGHPHHAFAVSPRALLRWKKRLNDAGVPTYGPTRLGPPGQASLYFNDPFGNHLELTTQGFVPDVPVGAPDMAALAYQWRST